MLLNCNRRPEQPNRYVLLGWKREISKAFARDSSGGERGGLFTIESRNLRMSLSCAALDVVVIYAA